MVFFPPQILAFPSPSFEMKTREMETQPVTKSELFLLFFQVSNVPPSTSSSSPPLFSLSLHPVGVIDQIRHGVRLHYAVLTDKTIAKQLFSFPLSPRRGCVSKRRTSLPGPDIIIYFDPRPSLLITCCELWNITPVVSSGAISLLVLWGTKS